MKKIAILLTTFNRKDSTLRCIESIRNNLGFDNYLFKIYIADSNSKDKTLEAINNLNINIRISNVGDNVYWSQGMNLAWQRAKADIEYDFYLWLNDDISLTKEAIKTIFKDYESLHKNSILVGVTSDLSGKVTYGGREKPEGKLIKPNGSIQKVKYINGNIVLIPKSVFERLGYIDNKYSHALGDIDYGLRAKKAGINVFISSKIIGRCSSNNKRSYKSISEILSKEKNLVKRIKKLNTPLILPFKEYYYFNRKHFNFFKTIKFTIGYTLLIIFPKLYFKLKQKT